MLKKILTTLVGIFLIYGAVGVAIKCGIGVLPVDAAITTLSNILHIKVGTVAIFFHGSFLVGQIILEKKDFRKVEFLQILNITFGGVVLNFVLYTLLKNFALSFYPFRLIIATIAFLVGAFGCILVLETHFVRTSYGRVYSARGRTNGNYNGYTSETNRYFSCNYYRTPYPDYQNRLDT